MRLKKVYHQDKLERDEQGRVTAVKPGAVAGVEILSATKEVQHLTQKFIDAGVQEGWLTMAKGRITVHPVGKGDGGGKPVVYRIVRVPGYYSCFDDAPIPNANLKRGDRTLGQIHVEENHPGEKSPDPNNPSGYRRDNFYACVLESGAQENLTPEEAAELERKVRAEFHARVAPKVNAARDRAEEKRSRPPEPKEALAQASIRQQQEEKKSSKGK